MKYLLPVIILFFSGAGICQVCDATQFMGPNLITNPGFEDGDTDFDTDIKCSWNDASDCDCHGSYSQPNQYYIGNNPQENTPCGDNFQGAFEGSPHSGESFMMVDGEGSANPVVWAQTISVEENTDYYFRVWISTLIDPPATRARLKFRIAGAEQDTLIEAPATTNEWVHYTQIWNSGGNSGNITIEIIDTQENSGGEDQDDFGLDDLEFRKGCPPSVGGINPDLGPDTTLCGTGGSITLDPGITPDPALDIFWSTGTDNGNYSIDVTEPGTYSVCVDTNGCILADEIVIDSSYTVNLPENLELCSPSSDSLDAGHEGPGVTYEWFYEDTKISIDRKVLANQSGQYKVIVTDSSGSCGSQADSAEVNLTSGAPSPENQYFCPQGTDTSVTLSVSGAGTYNWYDVPAGGTPLATNSNSFTTPAITESKTYYVEDVAISDYTMGSPVKPSGEDLFYPGSQMMRFEAYQDFTITSVSVTVHSNSGDIPDAEFALNLHSASAENKNEHILGTSDTVTAPVEGGEPSDVTFTVNNLPEISGDPDNPVTYYLSLYYEGTYNPYYLFTDTDYDYETSDYAGNTVVKVSGSQNEDDLITTEYGPFWDINIEVGSQCDRAPVIADFACALPVELIEFSGKRYNYSKVELNWVTASELNNSHFEIWHSKDGYTFEKIKTVPGAGNSNEVIDYSTEVNSPYTYFKIIQADYNGERSESGIIYIENEESFFNIYPNPSENEFILNTVKSKKGTKVLIYNMPGQLLQTFITSSPETRFGENLKQGTYLIEVITPTGVEHRVVIKQ